MASCYETTRHIPAASIVYTIVEEGPQAALKVDGYFEGTVVHAGHLRFECFMGLEGRMLPRGECYCVLLSARTLLCFESGSGSFNPSTGEVSNRQNQHAVARSSLSPPSHLALTPSPC